MAVDKLVDSTQLDADLTSVANAIRTKGGTSASLAFPAGFVSAVEAIPTGGGGGVESGSFTPATNSDHTWDLGSATHLAFIADTSPYGTGVRTIAAAIIDINQTDGISARVSSNASGSASSGWYGSNLYTISGTSVTVGGNSSAGYFIAGITYNWWTW